MLCTVNQNESSLDLCYVTKPRYLKKSKQTLRVRKLHITFSKDLNLKMNFKKLEKWQVCEDYNYYTLRKTSYSTTPTQTPNDKHNNQLHYFTQNQQQINTHSTSL